MPVSELWYIWQTAILALVLWREARGEGELGMRAVACSIVNRVNRPAWWGDEIATVVSKRLQYSSMTKPGDAQLTRFPESSDGDFAQAIYIAYAVVMEQPIENPVPGADSFYDDSIPAPDWATPDCFVAKIGHISFFNVDRDHESAEMAQICNRQPNSG